MQKPAISDHRFGYLQEPDRSNLSCSTNVITILTPADPVVYKAHHALTFPLSCPPALDTKLLLN